MSFLTWGLCKHEIEKLFPGVQFVEEPGVPVRDSYLLREINFPRKDNKYSLLQVRNFPGDCGALMLRGANSASYDQLKDVLKYASLSGFSKIFATVVGEEVYLKEALAAFKKARFKLVAKGNSNRNAYKYDYVFVKYIRNCKYKGY